MDKKELLEQFRNDTNSYLEKMFKNSAKSNNTRDTEKKNAKSINKYVTEYKNKLINKYVLYNNTHLTDYERLNRLLLINYTYYIVMLESRNKCWPYEYMAFARRIGELWEPFCKIPFITPINKDISIYIPESFTDIQNSLKDNTHNYIKDLPISEVQKKELSNLYKNIWNLIDSESINMLLDLHIKKSITNKNIYYDIDYKSGFSSNEKGNTNRLLMVAGIYKSLKTEHHNILLVRQEEDQNNHYLKTLENSGLWDIYCGNATYDKIKEFTGFDLKLWMNTNMDWNNDITKEFKNYLENNGLIKYLAW